MIERFFYNSSKKKTADHRIVWFTMLTQLHDECFYITYTNLG